MLLFDATPTELAQALNKATADVEQMGDEITEATDAPFDDENEEMILGPETSNNLGVELGDTFKEMSEEGKEDLRQELEPVHQSISKVCTST